MFLLVAACSEPTEPDSSFERLIEAEWTLAPGEQAYVCAYQTVPEDMFVGEFVPVIPLGTHHTVLTIGEPTRPDGVERCGAANQARTMLFGSGVGTNAFAMPPGVAVRLRAGTQLTLNLHLFNASDAPLTGLSGTDVRRVDPDDVAIEAEAILAGPLDLDIPPGPSTSRGTCTITDPVTIFGIGSHMHLLGRHMTVTAQRTGKPARALFDHAYSFDAQVILPVEPFSVAPGDRLETACAYVNDTGVTVHWGEGTEDEMCFAGIYWYPAYDTPFLCAS